MSDHQPPSSDFLAKWRGYPGKIMASVVGFTYTAAIFSKMPRTALRRREPIFWIAFASGTCVNMLICNLLFALIEDEMKIPADFDLSFGDDTSNK